MLQICLSDDTGEDGDSDASPARLSQPRQTAGVAQAAADTQGAERPAAAQHPILERNRRALQQLQRAAEEEPVDLLASSEGERMRCLRAACRCLLPLLRERCSLETPGLGCEHVLRSRRWLAEDERPSAAPAAIGESCASPPQDERRLRVVVVCDRGKLTVQLAPTKPLQILFDAFRHHAEKQQWAKPGRKMRFCNFDGDPLKASDTLAELDYEDDDRIDVVIEVLKA